MPKAINLAGQRFGRLVAIEQTSNNRGGAHWICRCDCGRITTQVSQNLRLGRVKSCGMSGCYKSTLPQCQRKDITGLRSGLLTAVRYDGKRISKSGNQSTMWLCQCDCGNTARVAVGKMIQGVAKSCGCLRKPLASHDLDRSDFPEVGTATEVGVFGPKHTAHSAWSNPAQKRQGRLRQADQ